MAEEVVVGAGLVPSIHKRKLEDLEPEAPGHAEQSAEQQNHLSAELDADKKAGEQVDGDFPEKKRLRLDEEKPDGLACDNGSKEGLTYEHAKEDTGEPGVPNEKPQDDVQPSSEEIPKANDNEEPPTGDDKEITDTQQASKDSKSENLEEPSFGVIEKPSAGEPSIGVTEKPSAGEPSIGVTEKPSAGEPSIGITEELSAGEPSIGVIEKPFWESEDPASEGQTTSRKMDVPNDKVGVLIGKGGDTICYLQYNSGAKIQFTRDADSDPRSTTRPVEIIGTISSINQAEKLIHAVIAEADAGGSPSLVARGIPTSQAAVVGDQLEMQVPNEKVGLIIGRGGDTIKSLQAKSGARIQVAQNFQVSHMDEVPEIFGNNEIEDVSWLCSLSESELDLLISLKKLIIQRAKVIGYVDLANKFDLKMLRALAFILMEYLKGKVKDSPHIPGSNESAAFIDGCNLLKCNLGDGLRIEELKACIGIDKRKRQPKRTHEEAASSRGK